MSLKEVNVMAGIEMRGRYDCYEPSVIFYVSVFPHQSYDELELYSFS